MDLTDLENRYGKIPAALETEANAVWQQLQEQSDHVIAAKFLSNFGIDDENSKLTGANVHRGVIVSLKPGYRISNADTWLHPNLNQCRALYDGGTFTNVSTLEETDCSAGVYAVQKINAIGDLVSQPHTIVDFHVHDARDIRKSWNGQTVESVYSTNLRDRTMEEAQEYAQMLGAQNKIRADFTNILYRGRGEYHFYNNGYKEAGLVLLSPLTGYRVVDKKDHAADYLSEELIDVGSLTPKQQSSLYTKAHWESCDLVNTFVTRKSFSPMQAEYRMQRGNFSAANIMKHLTPRAILKLTPSSEHVPKDREIWDHLKEDHLEIPITSATMKQLLELRDMYKILNPKYYRDGKLILTREIVANL
tara:strand:- start:1060 stop:2145 length:1086 start_codon:yes stop_codon:yes gene_type:complete